MSVTRLLVVSALLCARSAAIAHAGPTDWLVLSLDVPEERAPTRLCVLSRVTCGPPDNPCAKTMRLKDVAQFFDDQGDPPSRFLSPKDASRSIPTEIGEALHLLAAAPSDRKCASGGYGACLPEISCRSLRRARPSCSP